MKRHTKTRTRHQRIGSIRLLWGYALIVAIGVGCRKDEVVNALPDRSAAQVPAAHKRVERPAAVNSVQPDLAITQSPATAAPATDEAASTPERVCHEFIRRLQSGDRIGAENLLTRAALTTTQQADLKLEPICSPNASTEVITARYETNLQRSAQVDCVVTDSVGGETEVIPMTWQVERQGTGWRVSGMLVPMEDANQTRLLSFESIDDVATLKLLATGEALTQPKAPQQTMRQAEANKNTTTMQ